MSTTIFLSNVLVLFPNFQFSIKQNKEQILRIENLEQGNNEVYFLWMGLPGNQLELVNSAPEM